MPTPPTPPTPPARPTIGGAAITSLVLAVLGLVCALWLVPGLRVLGALLGLAAAIVGLLAVINARRRRQPAAVAWIGLVVGAFAAIYWLVWWIIVY